jgi:DNA-binding response OmpR family regulator
MTALLLAEPEPAVRGFLERQLRNDGFDVVSCERAEQLPRAADPDVLLLGDADALDRGVVPDCPVIVLGGADPAARVRALARADDCLARPFVYEELLAIISHSAQTRFRLHAGLLCHFGV